MKQIIVVAILMLAGTGCASLSKVQREEIKKWSAVCAEFSGYPSQVLKTMADFRKERGVFYAASLTSPPVRIEELDAIHKGWVNDYRLSGRMDAAAEAMGAYARALEALSNPARYEEFGVRARSLGRRLDSLVIQYNQWNLTEPLPVGYGTAAGRSLGFGGNLWIKHRQARALKPFITQADTLIGTLTKSVLAVLNNDMVLSFLANEEAGLRENYLSFLQHEEGSPMQDRQYLKMLAMMEELKELRRKSASAARTLRNAHARLCSSMKKEPELSDYLLELDWAEQEIKDIRKSLDNIQNPKSQIPNP